MKQAKRVAVSSNEFGAVLEIINAHRAKALVSVNVEHLLTNWEIGGYLSAKIKHEGWGKSTIDNLVDYIHTHAPSERGYGRSNLYSMVAVYDEFTSSDFTALVARYGSRIVQPVAGQIAGPADVQPAAAQIELKARSFRPADMGQLEFYLEALDRDVKRANENPSVGVLLCKNADRSTVEYALSRSMSPAMVAEYKRLMIPKEVLQETFNRYIGVVNK